MKKKVTALMASALGALALGTSVPEAATALANADGINQSQPAQNSQQANRNQTNKVAKQLNNAITQRYMPFTGPGGFYGGGGVSPKDYGLYLLRTGKNKYNDRKNKHYSKAWS